jgi:hypothetical protein
MRFELYIENGAKKYAIQHPDLRVDDIMATALPWLQQLLNVLRLLAVSHKHFLIKKMQ